MGPQHAPAVWAVGRRAVDGHTRDSSVEPGKGVHALHGEVGAEGDPGAAVDEAAECVEPFDTLWALGDGMCVCVSIVGGRVEGLWE